MTKRPVLLPLAGICALAVGLRLYGIGWGLPDLHHPDEPYILNRALAFATGDLNPRNFLYPTLYLYALFVWEGLFFIAGRVAGLYGSVAAFEREFFVDPSRLVMAGRALTALFGVATVAASYRFGARLFDRATGLGAALLLAVAPFAVRDAHYIKLDVPVTLFVVLAQAAVAALVVDPAAAGRTRAWMAAGALAGLALSTQYYAFPVILSIVVAAAIQAHRSGGWRRPFACLAWAGVASIVAFLATSPYFLSDWSITTRDMVAVREIDVDRAVEGAGAFTSLDAYIRMMATDAVGWTTACASIAGVVIALARDPRRGLVLACFPIAFLAFLANTVPMSRYLNPMLPSLSVAAAFAVTRGVVWIWRGRAGVPAIAVAAACGAVALPGLFGSVRSDTFYRQADTRTLAREFIERTAPAGTTVLVQPHSVRLHASRDALVEALRAHLGSESLASIKFQKQLDAALSLSPAYRVLYLGRVTDTDMAVDTMYVDPGAFADGAGLQPLRDRRVVYVALNRYNGANPLFGPLDAALRQEARLLATFSPYRAEAAPDRRDVAAPFLHNTARRIDPTLERPGPVIDIWNIK